MLFFLILDHLFVITASLASFGIQVIADDSLIGSAEQDEIVSLPGISFPVTFKQYAGYLQGSETDFLHYWFIESQSIPASDPLVFWFNGGPGCSSIATGFLEEMGPFTMGIKELKQNSNAWNKQANVVFLDAPSGTGYSYSSSGVSKSSDTLTAQGNYEALKSFFRKFSAFRNHTLFVTGESYGGVSVPLFAEQIIDGQSQYPVNLGGVAVVNGLVEQKLRHWPYHDTVLNFVYSHGWIDEAIWKKLEIDCCKNIQNCPFFELEGDCKNCYKIGGNLPERSDRKVGQKHDSKRTILNQGALVRGNTVDKAMHMLYYVKTNPYSIYDYCDSENLKHSWIKPNFFSEKLDQKKELFIKKPTLSRCQEKYSSEDYLDREDVRKALNVKQGVPFKSCQLENYKREEKYYNMSSVITKILNTNIPVVLFYGDTDLVCNFLMGQKFAENLQFKKIQQKQPWEFNGKTAGFKTLYEKI